MWVKQKHDKGELQRSEHREVSRRAICSNMPPEKMLPFAAQVAATCCRAVGARTGLPHCTDARLASFLS
ncbi:hypothetical protein ACE6H2_028212 [Prunus campanulata]